MDGSPRSPPIRFTLTWFYLVHEVSAARVSRDPRKPRHANSCRINFTRRLPFFLSTDKTLIVWDLTRDELNYGIPKKRLYGHSHFVSDVVLSSDGNYALSGSWDKTLRLWDLAAGRTTRRFEDHTKVQIYLKLFFSFFFLLCLEAFLLGKYLLMLVYALRIVWSVGLMLFCIFFFVF